MTKGLEPAEQLHYAADLLTDRISKVENYFANLPSRVDAVCRVKRDNDTLYLRLHRKGPSWIISVAVEPFNQQKLLHELEWKRITDISMQLKMACVDLFPDLYSAVKNAQVTLSKDLMSAVIHAEGFLHDVTQPEQP